MKLKSLEIKGFKSFADKTILHFDDRITGVVGPNGCGKSNVVDSIRWVIGEHKIKNLRSDNLESLIFNGSKNRSGSSLAEVHLTFEGTKNIISPDYDTITISRRYFRNGDSEYRINDIPCKSKDIHSLFIDTGISPDSYAIIELGMIDDLIKNKENSRKKMLEQTAGVSIFKIRKRETELKLDLINTDLTRIEDLLYEINNQLKFLESQARKAKRYNTFKTEYKKYLIDYTKLSIKNETTSMAENTKQIEELETESIKKGNEIHALEVVTEKQKIEILTQEEKLKEHQETFNSLNLQLAENNNNKALRQQEKEHLNEKIGQHEVLIESSQKTLDKIQQSIEVDHQSLITEQNIFQELENEKNQISTITEEQKRKFDEEKKRLEDYHSRINEHKNKKNSLEKEIAVTETSLSNTQHNIEKLENENIQIEEETKQLNEKVLNLSNTYNTLDSKLKNQREEEEKKKKEKNKIEENIESLKEKKYSITRSLDANKNEHDLLKSLIDNMDGYPESMKYLRNTSSWHKDIPILGDILHVRQEEYKIVIENVLETYLNHFIVENINQAIEAVNLLNSSQKGKSSFLLLNKFATPLTQEKIHLEKCICALDIVDTQKKYQSIIKHLLHNIYLCDIETIQKYESKYPHLIFAEKNGKFYKTAKALTGGSIGLFEGNKLGRMKKLQSLQEIIKRYEANYQDINQQLDSELTKLDTIIKDSDTSVSKKMEDELLQMNNQLITIHNKIEHAENIVKKNKVISIEHKSKLEELTTKRTHLHTEIESLANILQDLEIEKTTQLENFNTTNTSYSEIEKRLNNLTLQITKQQAKIENLQNKITYNKEQVENLQNQSKELEVSKENAQQRIQELINILNDLEKEHIILVEEKTKKETILQELENTYQNMRHDIRISEDSLRELNQSKNKIDNNLISIREEINNLKLSLTSTKERLSIEFNLSLEDIINYPMSSEEYTMQELQEKTEFLKTKLSNLGEVNPIAIETYEEIQKRKDLIETQKNDLLEAKKDLIETITEVEEKVNKSFLETFHSVKENFIKVFKTLFTDEDECDLVLTYPENISETNIEIIAKPKGKRPTNISQLSGGEKSLTAVALLFAFYLIKPAPFCIFDEIDAPLDDHNILKFTKMIKKFSSKSQFIIVTHNKLTMSAMESIYGVTMQEVGISKIVPVAFKDIEEIAL